ncbi:glycerophosphodiester phosphodiesterase family protein [Streptomyces sp. 891-h]|uniref:glycerophosphodiester phosphodiesterase n=1 Tax=Streptomyces sp. 891-h TaxID=2720714 RepID=UPI001FAAFE7F|nr:glycerophosphodiester phosphodiesterase family protein [Streptomyces sp. 891-h]UNZ20634.1 glycerophosphodiester phosphodiesterase [Streptomyces sp. 891-h]
MARHRFGGIADYVISLGAGNAAVLQPGATVTCWNMTTGGTQYTDLTESDGTTAIVNGELTADANGAVPQFYGPDGVRSVYLDANGGAGPRRRALATDLGDDVTTLRTDLDAHTGAANPHGTRLSDLADVYAPSIDALLVDNPFTIAHRGSGGEFPEHTLRAYEAALAAGATAIEVSVRRTADGVLVAFHDATLDRVTDHTGNLADWTFAALREQVRVTPQGLLGAGWADQPIPTLEEVMQALYGRCVIFLEAKSNDAIVPLQDLLLARYPGATRSVVWKAYYQSTSLTWAKSNEFTTWAYVDAGTTDAQMDAVDANVDMWGVPHGMTDARITDVVNRGKPVICWEVHRHTDVTRLTGLGVQGLMEAQWVYLNNQPEVGVDLFASQVSIPGTLGVANYNPTYALKYDGSGGAYINVVPNEAVLMGGHRAPDGNAHTIAFSMKWDTLPTPTLHSDVAFCKASDDKFEYFATDNSAGYTLFLRANGDVELRTHTSGSSSSTLVDSMTTETPVAGAYMDFSIQVTATQVIITRSDVGPYTLTVNDTSRRGQYWHLSVGSVNSLTNKPTWSNITVA